MAIAFSTFVDLGNNAGSTTSLTAACNSGAGSGLNRLLVVSIGTDLNTASAGTDFDDITSVTYAGLAMTLAAKIVDHASADPKTPRFLYLYYLVNPKPGSNNVVISCANTHYILAVAAVYTGVRPQSPIDVTNTDEVFNSTAETSSIASSIFNCWAILTNSPYTLTTLAAITAGSGLTLRGVGAPNNFPSIFDSNGTITRGSAYSMTVNMSPACNDTEVIATLAPALTQTQVILTSASATPWVRPGNFPGTADLVELIGSGGKGSLRASSTRAGNGGGGGEYRSVAAYAIASDPTFSIPAAGTTANTTFNAGALIAVHGNDASTTVAGIAGTGGTGGWGFDGGAGRLTPTSTAFGGGGGGSGGRSGAGTTAAGQAGGAADNSTVAGGAINTVGSSGTEWTSAGSGSGAGGATSGQGNGKVGGEAGGGGSGHDSATGGTAANGAGGIVVITFTPNVSPPPPMHRPLRVWKRTS